MLLKNISPKKITTDDKLGIMNDLMEPSMNDGLNETTRKNDKKISDSDSVVITTKQTHNRRSKRIKKK